MFHFYRPTRTPSNHAALRRIGCIRAAIFQYRTASLVTAMDVPNFAPRDFFYLANNVASFTMPTTQLFLNFTNCKNNCKRLLERISSGTKELRSWNSDPCLLEDYPLRSLTSIASHEALSNTITTYHAM